MPRRKHPRQEPSKKRAKSGNWSQLSADLCEDCKGGIPFNDEMAEKYIKDVSPHGLVLRMDHTTDGEGDPISFGLHYERSDTLPNLPRLSESAKHGCHFCELLRQAIQSRSYGYIAPIKITFRYDWGMRSPDEDGLSGLSALVTTLSVLAVDGHEEHGHYFTFTVEADQGNSIVIP